MSPAKRRLLARARMMEQGTLEEAESQRRAAQQALITDSERREEARQGGLKGITSLGAIGGGLIAAPFTGGASLAATLAALGAGAAAGAGTGELIRQQTTGAAADGVDLGEIGKEAAIAGALQAGTFGLGKAAQAGRAGMTAKQALASTSDDITRAAQASAAQKRALKEAATQVDDLATAGGRSTSKGIRGKISDAGSRRLLNLKDSNTRPIVEAGKNPLEIGRKLSQKAGLDPSDFDDALGAVSKKGTGKINNALDDLGKQLTQKVKGQKVQLDDFYKKLTQRAEDLRKVGNMSGADRVEDLREVFRAQYGRSTTGTNALKIKKALDQRFGKAIVSGDDLTATLNDVQKDFGNYLRGQLKVDDEVAQLLSDQQDLIIGRDLLTDARVQRIAGTNSPMKSISGANFVNNIIRQPKVAAKLAAAAPGGGGAGGGGAGGGGFIARNVDAGFRAAGSPTLATVLAQGVGAPALRSNTENAEIASGAPITNAAAEPTVVPEFNATPTSGLAGTLADPAVQQQLYLADLLDPNSRGSNIAALEKIFELSAPAETEEDGVELNASQQKTAASALSGLDAIEQIRGRLGKLKLTAVPGAGLFSGLGDRILGTGELETSIKEAADVITRLRTGAAINASEEAFYRSQLPQAFDSPETVEIKLQRLEELFTNLLDPQTLEQKIEERTGSNVTTTASGGTTLAEQAALAGVEL